MYADKLCAILMTLHRIIIRHSSLIIATLFLGLLQKYLENSDVRAAMNVPPTAPPFGQNSSEVETYLIPDLNAPTSLYEGTIPPAFIQIERTVMECPPPHTHTPPVAIRGVLARIGSKLAVPRLY